MKEEVVIKNMQAAWANRYFYRNEGFNNSVGEGRDLGLGSQGKLPRGRWNLLRTLEQRVRLESLGGRQHLYRGSSRGNEKGGWVFAVYLGWGILELCWSRRLFEHVGRGW